MADDSGRRPDDADRVRDHPDDTDLVGDDRDADGGTDAGRDADDPVEAARHGDGAADGDPGADGDVSANGSSIDAATVAGSDRTETAASGSGARPEVVVPMDVYKTVTVFSTLFAVALVVGGMIALDAATARATAEAAEVNLPLAFLGVAAIVLGAATYAFASRFRAAGMGNAKDADDEA